MSQQINLLNPLLKRQRDYFSFQNMLQAIGFVIFGSMLFYGYAFYQSLQLTKQFEDNAQRYNAEQARLTRFTSEFSPQQSTEELQAEASKLENELGEQKELIEALNSRAGGITTGFSEYMRAFSRQVVQGLWLTGFKISSDGMGDGADISLSGGVLNPELLPTYIQRLGKEKIMHGKTFSTLQIQVGAGKGLSSASPPRYVEFTLHSTPVSEAKK
ncbi:MAG: fimbrial assembly protein [Gallionella sp.]|nr:fimbrial assembly protein [Gallionella sp.]